MNTKSHSQTPKYQNYDSIQQTLKGIQQQKSKYGRVIKYFTNIKQEFELQKPKYSTTQGKRIQNINVQVLNLGLDQHNRLVKQLEVNSYDYTKQELCENPASQWIESNYQLKSSNLRNSKPNKLIKQHVKFDISQMQSFMQNFEQEVQNRKKSKYETIINRLKNRQQELENQQTGYLKLDGLPLKSELNIKDVLKSMTPQFDTYQKQKKSFLEITKQVTDFEEKQKQIVPKTIKKLGLLTQSDKEKIYFSKLKRKAQNWEKRYKTEAIDINSYSKTDDPKLKTEQSATTLNQDGDQRKTSKFNSDGASLIAFQFQQKQIEQNLKKQEIEGQYFCPFQIKQLLKTKNKIKNFYESILEFQKINHIDYKLKESNVKNFLGSVKITLNDWFNVLMSQSEKMEQHLVDEIKEEVINTRQRKKLP